MSIFSRLFRSAPPVETKATLAAPDAELLAIFGAGTVAGSLSAAAALEVPAVSAAVRVISEAVATLDVQVLRVDGGEAVPDPEHPVAKLLTGDANAWTSGFELIRDLVAEALTRDAGGLAWVNRVDGRVSEVIAYAPGTIGVALDRKGEATFTMNGATLDPDSIIHLRGPFSRSPLSMAASSIAIARAMAMHAGNLFANGARPSGVIEIPKVIGEEGLKRMKGGWQSAHSGPDNGGKTAILWDGATFRPLTFSSVDAQFLELRKFEILEVARSFRVPPSMLYELDRATWSNGEQMGKEFLTYSLEPWLRAGEAALARGLFTPDERRVYRIRFDRDDLTRADLGARATAYSSLIASRVISPNEARQWEGLPPYADGDAFTNPNITAAPQPPKEGGQA